MTKIYDLINALIAAVSTKDPSHEEWTDAVATDPTEPRTYEGD